MLEERIQKDLVTAMKEKDNVKVNAIRSIKAAITNEKANGKFHELSDQEITAIIQKLSKQRKEAADIYSSNGRSELAEKELAEKSVIDAYLPKMMDTDELKQRISDIISETGASSIKQMGIVMKTLKERYAGQYEASEASSIIKSVLK